MKKKSSHWHFNNLHLTFLFPFLFTSVTTSANKKYVVVVFVWLSRIFVVLLLRQVICFKTSGIPTVPIDMPPAELRKVASLQTKLCLTKRASKVAELSAVIQPLHYRLRQATMATFTTLQSRPLASLQFVKQLGNVIIISHKMSVLITREFCIWWEYATGSSKPLTIPCHCPILATPNPYPAQ